MATNAIEPSQALTPRNCPSFRLSMIAAGMKVRYSETMTVARMYTLSNDSSMPRDELKANQDGLIKVPLPRGLAKGSRYNWIPYICPRSQLWYAVKGG